MTSAGALGFGAGWDWPDTDAEVVRRLIVFLEDRRVLGYGSGCWDVGQAVQSVLQIRGELTKTLQELAPKSGASEAVRALRQACVVFLDDVDSDHGCGCNQRFSLPLGELQRSFVLWTRVLAKEHHVTVQGPLAWPLHVADLVEEELREIPPGP